MELTRENVLQVLKPVMHPMINASLLDLDIIKDVQVKDGEIHMVMAMPFAQIYENVKRVLIEAATQPLAVFDAKVKVKLTIMDDAARERFLELENKNWKQ
ncbi:MAG: hypothetical protein DRO88_02315 [Promethearchaeia archaeon]|nr:MAG: hypothetical protein DRO88_02315 [Candidatus Lokiarchaeia archaeon]